MNKTKGKFYITEFYAVFVFVMTVLVLAIAIYVPRSVKSPCGPIAPPVHKDIIVEKRDDGTKLVKNVKEGFNVVLPEGFGVNEKTYSSSNVLTFYGGKGENACKIEVYVSENKEKLPIKEWLDETTDKIITITRNDLEELEYNGKKYYKRTFSAEETGESIAFFFEKGDKIIEVISYVDDTSYVCDNNIEQIAKSIE